MRSAALSGLLVLTALLQIHAQSTDGITLTLRGVTYGLNDIVTLDDVGRGEDGLTATTTHRPCCDDTGSWFLPDSTSPLTGDSSLAFYQSRTSAGELVFNRKDVGAAIDGVLRCNIPNASGVLVDVHIGAYSSSQGAPTVSSLTIASSTLTCTSSGGPATNVVWRRNCSPLTGPAYTTSQRVVDTRTAMYESTLTLSQVDDGIYSCTVENRQGRSSKTIPIGSTYNPSLPFTVTITTSIATPTAGQPLNLTCSHDSTDTTSSASYEWLDRNGTVISDSPTLTFDPLRESDQEFYCVVTMESLVVCNDVFLDIQVPSFSVTMDDVSGTALSAVTFSCALSGPSVPMVMYSFYKGGGLVSGPSSSEMYTIGSPQLSDAGDDYACEAVISVDYLDRSSPLSVRSSSDTTLSLTIPAPILVLDPSPGTLYSGRTATIQCSATLPRMVSSTSASLSLIRQTSNGNETVTSSSRITASPVRESVRNFVFTREYLYSVLSQQEDEGDYFCAATIQPDDPALQAFVTSSETVSSTRFIGIVDPTLSTEVSMVMARILDIAPYNMFTLSCSASSSVEGAATPISKTLQWRVAVDRASPANVTEGVVSSALDEETSSSVLTQTVSSAGEYVYSCESELELGAIPDQVTSVASTTVTVYGPSPPDPPTTLTVIQVNHQSASIQWTVTDVLYDNESYIVTYGSNPDNLLYNSTVVMGRSRLPNQAYSVEISVGLEPLSQYYYRVEATNNVGTTQSPQLTTFNTTGVGPSAPLSLRYTRATPTNHTFHWLPPNDTDITVNLYELTCQASLIPGNTLPNLVLETMATSVDAVLTPWSEYTCFVVASNSDGSSPPSNEISFTTPETPPTGLPEQPAMIEGSMRGMVMFLWGPPPIPSRNGDITHYSLNCTAGPEVVSMVFPASQDNMYTAVGFAAVTAYSCSVRAVNSAGEGPPALFSIVTGEDVPGASPMNFMVETVTATMVNFSWSPPPVDQQNGELTGYEVQCSSSGSPVEDVSGQFSGMDTVSGSLSGFTPARRYSCELRAATLPGSGPPASLTLVTLPPVPGGVRVTALFSRSLTVEWSTLPADLISEYIVYVDGAEAGTTQGLKFVVMALSPFTEYTVEVSARNEAGEGERSEPLTVTTEEDFPGPVSCELRWFSSNTTSVTVRWAPPTQENGVTRAYHLRLFSLRAPTLTLAQLNVTSDVRNVTLSSSEELEDGVPYSVEVVAENNRGRGTQLCVSTDFNVQLAPPAPSNVMVTRSPAGDALTVTWDIPSLVEAQGFVTYTVTFEPSTSARRKRQSMFGECTMSPCTVPVEEGGVVIVGVDAERAYDLLVSPSNEEGVSGEGVTEQAPTAPPTAALNIAVIAGAAGGGVVVLLLLLIILVVIIFVCCRRARKGRYDPEPVDVPDFPLHEYKKDKNLYSATNLASSPSSSGTTSPRRELTSPLHMSVKDFLEPVPLDEFSDFVAHMHQDRNKGFERAFNSLPNDQQKPHVAAKKNEKKNRFQNIFPYDENRVRLDMLDGEPNSDYINASYIDGYKKPKMYIATQGPMPKTIDDFWRMIWEQRNIEEGHKSIDVVMLTKCKEKGKMKCEQYWPNQLHEEYTTAHLSILCNEVTQYADYEIRKFYVSALADPDAPGVVVKHYLFTGWPDHGVPEYATALIGFIRRVKANYHYEPGRPPMVVHCTAGVGRTGTFIVLDMMLERLKEQSTVNVYETLRDIRLSKAYMVQTQDQFMFIHDALNELILCGDTEISVKNIRGQVAALHNIRPGGEHVSQFNYQFQLLEKVSPNIQELQEALQHYNQHKNRYQDKVPNTNSAVFLDHVAGVPGREYINASFINGYKHQRAYIATQAPLETTVEDFWRMVWKFESRAIVMLCDLLEEKKEVSHRYWPEELENPVACGELWVKMVSEEELEEGLIKRKFFVSLDQTFSPENKKLSVSQFHYTMWPEHDRPMNTDPVRRILDEVDRVQRSTSNKPITVMCNDGMGRTGAFIAIHSQWERIKTEGVADLFQFVKSARVHRSNLIIELEHYIFCHDTLTEYVDTFEASDYANFK